MANPKLSADTVVLFKATTFSNANYTVLTTDVLVSQVGTMSAARLLTLPTAASFTGGTARRQLIIVDESGSVGALNTLVITAAGSDKINGAGTLTLNSAYATAVLISDGASKWTRII